MTQDLADITDKHNTLTLENKELTEQVRNLELRLNNYYEKL